MFKEIVKNGKIWYIKSFAVDKNISIAFLENYGNAKEEAIAAGKSAESWAIGEYWNKWDENFGEFQEFTEKEKALEYYQNITKNLAD